MGFIVTRVIRGVGFSGTMWPMKSSVREGVRNVVGSGLHVEDGRKGPFPLSETESGFHGLFKICQSKLQTMEKPQN
jgi:hypothetical protein